MLIHAAFLPPKAALEAVDAVVRAVPVPVPEPEPAPAPEPARDLRGRLGRHRALVAEEPVPASPPVMLDHVPIVEMSLPITGFGNLTASDVTRLVDAVTAAASRWQGGSVRLAGGTALDFPGDWSVWAKVDGDVGALLAAARGVTQSVEHLNYYVDRRVFRPSLSVATVTRATTGPFLEEVVAALEAFHGTPWPIEISLLKETFAEGPARLAEFQRVRLGS